MLELPWVWQIAPQSKAPPTSVLTFSLSYHKCETYTADWSLSPPSTILTLLYLIDISPNKSILPLTLSWHLLPRGLDCLKESSPFYNENVMALCLSCYQGIRRAQSIIGNLLSVAIKCGCLFLWTLSCNSSEVFSSLEFTVHFLPSSSTLTWLGSIHSSGSGTDQYLSFQEAFSDLTSPKALVDVSEELYISLLYQLHYITWKLHGYLPH